MSIKKSATSEPDTEQAPTLLDVLPLPEAAMTDGTRRWDSPMGQITRVMEECRVESPHLTPAGRECIPSLIEALWLLSEGKAQIVMVGE